MAITGPSKRITASWLGIGTLIVCAGSARAVDLEDVPFEVNFETTFGQSVYVLGDIPELGNNDPALSVKLEPSNYPTWRAAVAIPKGTSFSYQYTWRDDSVPQWPNSSNHNPIGSVVNAQTAPADPHPARKGLYYHSAWTSSVLHWRTLGDVDFIASPMQAFGAGRSPGETRWRSIGVGTGCTTIEFYFTDGGTGRDPVSGNYATQLDGFFVQDGEMFDYTPAAIVSPQHRDYVPASPPSINSTHLGELRPYRVLLPRGYDEHTDKNYPVLYMHDGQNIFEFGPFGSWLAHNAAEEMTRSGSMREIIIVGVDNTINRARDYIPPEDTVPIGPGAGGPGRSDDYAAFLIEELKPIIDANYRTYANRENTGTLGSSLGGLVSLYLGWDFNSVFGRVGPMSGAWLATNFQGRVAGDAYQDLRVYYDSGDCCAPSYDNAWGTMNMRDNFLAKGYVLGRDMMHVVGYGQQHNEAAWAQRVPLAFTFLFPATESENPLLEEIFTGDLDHDGDMDADDFALFEACFTGEAEAVPAEAVTAEVVPAGCEAADFDGDGDVDCTDLEIFQQYWSDPAPPPSLPECEQAPSIPAVSFRSLIVMMPLLILAFIMIQRRNATAH